ncbi:MAG TPA: YebC/PmpR family DNA-binding transcriptional regulator [Acidobacteriota bacterium]|nr:YebC/PmpR family DNA-binding transcriptional regulator [Acidobacteriota bacterium]
MSGHSKWSSIKHKKAAVDAKRGKLFGRLIREITIAARMGGGDENANSRLRRAVAGAKAANMPMDNIQRAILKGTGELEGTQIEEITYGGFAPGGVAILIEVMTDNRNRTTPEIRHIFSRHGGNLAETGSVAHLFERKGYILVDGTTVDEDNLLEIALEAGAEDMSEDEGNFEILTDPNGFDNVVDALSKKEISMLESQIAMIPGTLIKVEGKQAEQVLKMVELFDDHEDVQNIWTNFDIDEELLQS